MQINNRRSGADNSYLPGVSSSRPGTGKQPKTAQARAAQRNAEGTPQQPRSQRPQMPKMEVQARLRDSRRMVPGGPGADTFLDDAMPFLRAPRDAALRGAEAVMPFLRAPGQIARGAVEGGIQAINPDFQMPGFGSARPTPPSFEEYVGNLGIDGGMPMPRNIDPGTDAILRAIMARMQGGQ
jgi:hypothetical protein